MIKSTMTTEQLQSLIARTFRAEKVSKQHLSTLSRELLAHAWEHKDCSVVNSLIIGEGLSPMNKRVACLYFVNFMPFSHEEVSNINGEKTFSCFKNWSERKASKMFADVEAWLSDKTNDIWNWSNENVQVEKKPKEYADKITKLIQKALKDEKEGISVAELVEAVVKGGVELSDLLDVMTAQPKQEAA